MIHISLEEVRNEINLVNPEWFEKARKLRDALIEADSSSEDLSERRSARKLIIDNDENQKLWKQLKQILSKVSHYKCWYCETWETRSDTAVDHFRPKNAIKECDDHDGYWWLTFDWTNYRFSCQFCNEKRVNLSTGITGGKGTSFPLVKDEDRVYQPVEPFREEPDLVDPCTMGEKPLLLDPVIEGDVLLLHFEEDGRAEPLWTEKDYPLLYKRAKESILLYNLNKDELKERRQLFVCLRVKLLIKKGNKYFRRMINGDPAADEAYNEVLDDLRNMIAPTAEHSATAKSVISLYRHYPWVDAYVYSRMR
jgi:uncharacterized protein (TIGR02646 family)